MSILDRKPKKYDTSDLFWEPSAAPSDGAVGDINTMRLKPEHLGMAQDVIIDSSGVLRNRGSIQSYTSDTFTTLDPQGMAQIPVNALSNGGTIFQAVDTSTNAVYLYGTSVAALTGFSKLTAAVAGDVFAIPDGLWPGATPMSPSFAKLPDDRGFVVTNNLITAAFVGWSMPYIWGGNAVTTSATTAGTAASTIGSKNIAGVGTAWTTALIGCYLFIGVAGAAKYVGQVDQVTSTTAIILRKGAQVTVAAAAPCFKTARLLQYNVYKGRITTSTTSTNVVGSGTKFSSSGPAGSGPSWMTFTAGASVFRYSDGVFIGTVSSVQNDTTLTLGANAAIAMANEEYYIINNNFVMTRDTRPGAAFSASTVEIYADRFWYGNITCSDEFIKAGVSPYGNAGPVCAFQGPNSLMFSKKGDPECLDLDPSAGDILKLPSSTGTDGIRALCATKGGLVVFRLNDTFLITGYSPETFRAIKIADDGIFHSHSFKNYGDGLVWAGKKSIWYFDGTRIVDLLQNKIKRFYRRNNAGGVSGAGLAVINDHIILSIRLAAQIVWPSKNTTKNMQVCTIAINMANGAISFFTNLFVKNSMINVDGTGLILANGSGGAAVGPGYIVNGDKIFNDSATNSDHFDAFVGPLMFSTGAQIGPDVMFETIKLSLGNAARMKFWKMFLMNYSSDVGMTASFIGVNSSVLDFPNTSTGTAGVVTLPVSSNIGILKRIKFLIRTPALMIRVYQTNTTTATSQRFKMFWYTVGGKWMREGRQQ